MGLRTRTRSVIAAAFVGIGIVGFAGSGQTAPRPTPNKAVPKMPHFTPPVDAVPDALGNVQSDFRAMGKQLGLTGDKLDAFVARSEAHRADEVAHQTAQAAGQTTDKLNGAIHDATDQVGQPPSSSTSNSGG